MERVSEDVLRWAYEQITSSRFDAQGNIVFDEPADEIASYGVDTEAFQRVLEEDLKAMVEAFSGVMPSFDNLMGVLATQFHDGFVLGLVVGRSDPNRFQAGNGGVTE